MSTYRTRTRKRWYGLIVFLVILGLLLQPLTPMFNAPVAYADDEFEPWCGGDCEDPDDDDDDDDSRCKDGDSKCNNDCSANAGSAINLFTGEEILTEVDLYLPGFIPLVIARTYRSQSLFNNRFGFGWDLNINQRLQRQSDGNVILNNGTCGRHIFEHEDDGYKSPRGLFTTLTELADGSYELREQDGSLRLFDRDGKLAAIRDRHNNEISLTYHPDGRLPIIGTSKFFKSQQRGVVGYDFQLTSITDSAGREIMFSYDADGRLSTIAYGGDRRIEYSYDANDNLVKVIDEAGNHTQYLYKDRLDPNNLTAIIDHEGEVLVGRTYNNADRVVSEVVAGHRSTVTYKIKKGRVKETTFTNGRGERTTYRFDALGNTIQVRNHSASGNEDDFIMRITYNAQNQIAVMRLAQGSTDPALRVNYTYDENGKVIAATSSDGQRYEAMYDLEHFSQPVQVTNLVGGENTFAYDASGNLDTIATPQDQLHLFDWSSQGQLTTETNPLSYTVRYGYDTAGNLETIIDELGGVTRLDYNDLGQIIGVTDDLQPNLIFEYDFTGRPTTIINSLSHMDRLAYDSRGNLIAYTDANSYTTRMTYSVADNLKSITDPLGETTSFDYDGTGNLIRKTDGSNIIKTYSYDHLGQLTGIQYADGMTVTYRYNGLSDLVEATTSQMRLFYDYNDGLPGQPAQVRFQGRGGNPVEATVTYDYLIPGAEEGQDARWRSGLVYGVTVQSTNQTVLSVGYEYDTVFNLTSLTSRGPTRYRYTFEYDAAERLTQMRPDANSTGVHTAITYDLADRITGWTNSTPDQSRALQDFVYSYDVVGNVAIATDSVTGAGTSYTYDAVYQLVRADLPDGIALRYVYDPVGNHISDITDGVTTTYQYDAANQLIASSARNGTTYTYDGNGNLRTHTDDRGIVTYTWNADNELIQIDYPDGAFIAYEYDALGRRGSRTNRAGDTTYYVYDGYNLVQEIDRTGAVKAAYVHSQALDHPLSMTRDGVTYYYLYDRLGSVVGLTDDAGTLVAEYIYDPWGNIIGGDDGDIENPFRFTAREWDADAGLYYFRTRYYDPEVGRFIQRDKIGLAGGPNLYVYVQNNPVNFVDPLGLGWLDKLSNFSAGFGDYITSGFGLFDTSLTQLARQALGVDNVVDPCSSEYGVGRWAGLGASLLIPTGILLRPFTRLSQTITHWNTAANVTSGVIRPGSWVMTGGKTIRNYVFSGVIQRGYKFKNSIPAVVPKSALKWPSGGQWGKGFLGQRIFRP